MCSSDLISTAFKIFQYVNKSQQDSSVEITDQAIAEKEKTLKNNRDNLKSVGDNILKIIRNTIHLSEVVAPRFRQTNEDVNQDARIQFIMNKYDDKKFASIIHKNNKSISKKQDIFNVIQLQQQGVTDIIFRMIDSLSPMDDIIDKVVKTFSGKIPNEVARRIYALYEEFETLTAYSNNLLREHSKTYQCKCWVIEHLTQRQDATFK